MEKYDWRFGIDDGLFQRVASMQFGLSSDIKQKPGQLENYWIENFSSVITKRRLHGSFDFCFENAAYKVRQWFINTKETLAIEKELISVVDQAVKDPEGVELGNFGVNILVGHLLLRGYLDEKSVVDFAKNRIQTLCETIQTYGFDIYIDGTTAGSVPKAYQGRKIVNPELTETNMVSLPLIYDVLYFHVLARHFPELRVAINRIIDYLLTNDYQDFPHGYGIGKIGKSYYAIGWSVTIPSFLNYEFGKDTLFNLIHLSHYKAAHHSSWFQKMLALLSDYENPDGMFEFPNHAIREKKNTYFVGGNHLGVVENRRLRKRNRMESTYWYQVIQSNMENAV